MMMIENQNMRKIILPQPILEVLKKGKYVKHPHVESRDQLSLNHAKLEHFKINVSFLITEGK